MWEASFSNFFRYFLIRQIECKRTPLPQFWSYLDTAAQSFYNAFTNTELVAKGTALNNALYAFIDKKNSLDVQIEELQRKEARMVMDGADLADIHEQLTHEGDSLMQDMNGFIKKFISDNYETVLGPSVFMMLCSTLPYPVMTPQIEDMSSIWGVITG